MLTYTSFSNNTSKNRIDWLLFGQVMPNRHGDDNQYRYGFQGQERDDEMKGDGNSLSFEYRMHDPRIGRFFAVDPLTKSYPHYTPYSFSGNSVINSIDIEGLEEFICIEKGNGFLVIWDIKARDRGEANTIMYVSNTGEIVQNVRALNNYELNNDYIIKLQSVPTPDMDNLSQNTQLNYCPNGTDNSLGYPSTGISNGSGYDQEALIQKSKLVEPPPSPVDPPAKTTGKTSSNIVAATSTGTSPKVDYGHEKLKGNWGWFTGPKVHKLNTLSTSNIKSLSGLQVGEIKKGLDALQQSAPNNVNREITKIVVVVNTRASAAQQSQFKSQVGNSINGVPVEFKPADTGNERISGNVGVYYKDTEKK